MDVRVKALMKPHGKANEVIVRRGRDPRTGKERTFGSLKKTDDTEAWEDEFTRVIAHQLPPNLLDSPVRIDILAVFPRPKYLCKVYKKTGLSKYDPGLLPYPKKPDWDNVVKSTQDSLKAHWTDDQLVSWGEVIEAFVELDLTQVVDGHAAQKKPRMVVRLRSVAQVRSDDQASISLDVFQASAYAMEGSFPTTPTSQNLLI